MRLGIEALDEAGHTAFLDMLTAEFPPNRDAIKGLIHHSDRGCQYLAIRHTERLQEAKIDYSVGSAGDSYDTVLAATIIDLY